MNLRQHCNYLPLPLCARPSSGLTHTASQISGRENRLVGLLLPTQTHLLAPPHLRVCQAPVKEEGRARNMQAIAWSHCCCCTASRGLSYPRTILRSGIGAGPQPGFSLLCSMVSAHSCNRGSQELCQTMDTLAKTSL